MTKNRIIDSWVMIILGCIMVISTCFFTYVRQYFDWQMSGESYANALYYLTEFPLGIVFVIGIILMCLGVALRIRRKE